MLAMRVPCSMIPAHWPRCLLVNRSRLWFKAQVTWRCQTSKSSSADHLSYLEATWQIAVLRTDLYWWYNEKVSLLFFGNDRDGVHNFQTQLPCTALGNMNNGNPTLRWIEFWAALDLRFCIMNALQGFSFVLWGSLQSHRHIKVMTSSLYLPTILTSCVSSISLESVQCRSR